MWPIFRNSPAPLSYDWASLLLRLVFGGLMAINHGWPKFQNFAEKSATFADPLGVGTSASLSLTILAELFCALLLILGAGTRLVLIPLAFAMLVAVFSVHLNDPLAKKELGLLYLFAYTGIFLMGSGRFSVDSWLARRRGVEVRGFQSGDQPRSNTDII